MALPEAERIAEFKQWLEEACAHTAEREAEYLSGDYELVDSRHRYKFGE